MTASPNPVAARGWSVDRVQLALRAIIVASGLIALAAVRLASDDPQPVLDLVAVGLICLSATLPDTHLGLAAVVLVAVDWMLAVDDVTTPWVAVVAVALTVFHAALAMTSMAPVGAALEAETRRRWAVRTTLVAGTALPTWLAVIGLDRIDIGSSQLLAGVALMVVALAALWARGGEFGRSASRGAVRESR